MRPQVADKVCQTLTHAVKRKAQHAEKISKNGENRRDFELDI